MLLQYILNRQDSDYIDRTAHRVHVDMIAKAVKFRMNSFKNQMRGNAQLYFSPFVDQSTPN